MNRMVSQKSIPNGPWDTLQNRVDFQLPSQDSSCFNNEYMEFVENNLSFICPHPLQNVSSIHESSSYGDIYDYQANEIMYGIDDDDDDEDEDFNDSKPPFYKRNDEFESKEQSQCLLPLLAVGHYNKFDLAELMIEQFHSSNLSKINHYISRSSLFHEICSNKNNKINGIEKEKKKVEKMLINYLKCYTKYIELPLPKRENEIPFNFEPFNDKIDIILSYYQKLNQCINEYKLIKTRPMQFDVYFVPPSASTHDLDDLDIKSAVKSCPEYRSQSDKGTEEIYSLLTSKGFGRLLENGNKRIILLIIRKNVNNTKGDILYLFSPQHDLKHNEKLFKFNQYNELLWKLNTKRDIIDSKLNVSKNNLFSISYHLHFTENITKSYVYFNGFGQKICKRDIMQKWPLLFERKHDKNKISDYFLNLLNNNYILPEIENNNNKNFEIGEYLFGLKYEFFSYKKTKRQTLTFPKDVLQNGLKQISEFNHQHQLYYYLTWTSKMQLIDGEFIHYILKHRQPKEIAIFNTELTEIHSKNNLYVVAILNDKNGDRFSKFNNYHNNNNNRPKWKMNQFMTAQQISNIYGINRKDLPKGSRFIHHYFDNEIHKNRQELQSNIYVKNWNRIEKIYSQQYKHDIPRFNDFDLNKSIKNSIDDIRRNNNLSLIPILNIDTKKDLIRIDSLIPIKIRNKWIAISYKMAPINSYKKTIVTGLYIDCDDIINKAALVDPNMIDELSWLKGGDNYYNNNNNINYRKHNNNNNNTNKKLLTRPVLRDNGSTGSTQSCQSTQSTQSCQSYQSGHSNESMTSIQSFTSLPSLQPTHSTSLNSQSNYVPLMASQSLPSCTNNHNHIHGNNQNKSASPSVNDEFVVSLQRQLNEQLQGNNMLTLMCKTKDQIIQQQTQQIQRLQQQLQQLQQQQHQQFYNTPGLSNLGFSMPGLASVRSLPSMTSVPSMASVSLPSLNDVSSNNDNNNTIQNNYNILNVGNSQNINIPTTNSFTTTSITTSSPPTSSPTTSTYPIINGNINNNNNASLQMAYFKQSPDSPLNMFNGFQQQTLQ